MFGHKLSLKTPSSVILNWLLFSFSAGTINACGYLSCGKFVSHVTGFATLFGIELANLRWTHALGIIIVPSFYFIGVVTSGFLISQKINRNEQPRYFLVLTIIFVCLIIPAGLGYLGHFGPFDGQLVQVEEYIMLTLLCTACGVQNGTITAASHYGMRVTHLTGVTTDLGLGLVKIFDYHHRKAPKNEQYQLEWKINKLRMLAIGTFSLGSVLGCILSARIKYLSLLVPAGITLFSAFQYMIWNFKKPTEEETSIPPRKLK